MRIGTLAKRLLWPVIEDDKSAASTVQTVSRYVFAWSAILIAIGLLDLLIISLAPAGPQMKFGGVASAFVWYTIGIGLIFGVIAWRVKTMSFVWAIIGLLLCILGAAAVLPSPFAFVICSLLALSFANASRATYKYKRTANRTKA